MKVEALAGTLKSRHYRLALSGIVGTLMTILVLIVHAHAQTQTQEPAISDLGVLVGKQVIAQRQPLCSPGTFAIDLAHAGKQATVVSLKPTSTTALPQRTMNSLAPAARAMLEDAQKSATILVKFEDGSTLDTCAPVSPRRLAEYFDVVPGQVLQPSVPAPGPVLRAGLPQECPVVVVKATSSNGGLSHALIDGLTKSEFERAMERAGAGGRDPHYLDTRMKNVSKQEIKAIEAFVVYTDKMGDPGATETILSQNDKNISLGGEYKGYAIDTAERSRNGKGEVTVYVNRVRFEDNTFWTDNGSHSCALTTEIKQ